MDRKRREPRENRYSENYSREQMNKKLPKNGREGKTLLESIGSEAEEVLREETKIIDYNIKDKDKEKRLNIVYAFVDGFLSAKLELNDYLRDNEPEMLCLVESNKYRI